MVFEAWVKPESVFQYKSTVKYRDYIASDEPINVEYRIDVEKDETELTGS